MASGGSNQIKPRHNIILKGLKSSEILVPGQTISQNATSCSKNPFSEAYLSFNSRSLDTVGWVLGMSAEDTLDIRPLDLAQHGCTASKLR